MFHPTKLAAFDLFGHGPHRHWPLCTRETARSISLTRQRRPSHLRALAALCSLSRLQPAAGRFAYPGRFGISWSRVAPLTYLVGILQYSLIHTVGSKKQMRVVFLSNLTKRWRAGIDLQPCQLQLFACSPAAI